MAYQLHEHQAEWRCLGTVPEQNLAKIAALVAASKRRLRLVDQARERVLVRSLPARGVPDPVASPGVAYPLTFPPAPVEPHERPRRCIKTKREGVYPLHHYI